MTDICSTCRQSALLTAGLIPHRKQFTDCHGIPFEIVDGELVEAA